MIVELKQERTNFNMSYRFSNKGVAVCEAVTPIEVGRLLTHLKFADGHEERLYFNPKDRTWGNSLVDRMSFKMLEKEEKIGRIYGATQKTGKLFGAYPYYRVEYRGEEYALYEVGLGKDGIFLCGYCGERVMFIAEKDRLVTNYQDTYTLFLDQDKDFPLAAHMLLYYDLTGHNDLLEVSLRSVKKDKLNTIQKELIAKYDADFVERIKARDAR